MNASREWEICVQAAGQRDLLGMPFGWARVHAGIVAEADVKFEINIVGKLGNLALGKIRLG